MVRMLLQYPLTNPMEVYGKMLRRVISHPWEARNIIRKFICKWKDDPKKRICFCCWCIWWQHKHRKQKNGAYIMKCSHCSCTYSELSWTILSWTKIPLHLWCQAILEWSISTWSLSAAELKRRIGVSENSALTMLQKIRSVCHEAIETQNKQLFSGMMEIDESWMGKKANQDIVLGIVSKIERRVSFVCISDTRSSTIKDVVFQCISHWSQIHSDNASYYSWLDTLYERYATTHSEGEFSKLTISQDGTHQLVVHSNTIEQIWWDFKWIVRTIHHWITKKYRKQYLAQYAFRYNCWKDTNLFYAFLNSMIPNPLYCCG